MSSIPRGATPTKAPRAKILSLAGVPEQPEPMGSAAEVVQATPEPGASSGRVAAWLPKRALEAPDLLTREEVAEQLGRKRALEAPDLLTREEVAEQLGRNLRWLARAENRGTICPTWIGPRGIRLYSLAEVNRVRAALLARSQSRPETQMARGIALAARVSVNPEQKPYLLYLASLARSSRPSMISALDIIARRLGYPDAASCPWHELRYEHTQALRTWCAEKYAPATANKFICAVRGVLRQAHRLEMMSSDAYQRAKDIPSVRGSRVAAGRAIVGDECTALFAACDMSRPLGFRDAAMLALLYGLGIRRAELVSIDVENISGLTIKIHGKGRKERLAYLPTDGLPHVKEWLRIRGELPGPLLYPTTKNGRMLVACRMSSATVVHALRALAKRARVSHFTPHDFRRTFVGDLLDAGADLPTVQQMAGHSSATTTSRYDRRGERAKASATELLFRFRSKARPDCDDGNAEV